MPAADREAELKHIIEVWLGASDEDNAVGALYGQETLLTRRLSILVCTLGAIDKL